MSTGFKRKDALKISTIALALLLPGAMYAATPAAQVPVAPAKAATPATPPATQTKPTQPKVSSKPGDKTNEELNQVTISAEKPTRKVADLIPFLRRILGEYSVDGKVDLGGQGKPDERWSVYGSTNCVGFGVAPGVQCELNIKWPPVPGPNAEDVMSGITAMSPTMVLYGLEPDELGIRYLQVNSRGLAEGATGYMIDDTVTFKTPCVNTAPGCERITKITARSDSKIVDMQIDTEVDYKLAARFTFKLRRIAKPQEDLSATGKPAADTRPAIPTKEGEKKK
ncbi:MAG: hypothetical protein ABI645_01660 [Pseudomonadota bacterium]